ncbi:MAG: hypothetical protein JSW73_04025 [Candidatus Woesearchaeota archaeon]|nr:MAG: hypothetical protein JSW73_04025 [Candidatus Woesearchaeota archaeon]
MQENDLLMAEFIGAVIGDGNLWSKDKHYRVEITGDPILDKEYFENFLIPTTKQLFAVNPHVRVRQRGLRLRITSKDVYSLLTNDYKLPTGREKGMLVTIPKSILNNTSQTIACIRGIFDTDGSAFLANKGYRQDYPTIEISTTSEGLANQIRDSLVSLGYRVGFRSWKREIFRTKWVISVNGDSMFKKWMDEIGTSNPRHLVNSNL